MVKTNMSKIVAGVALALGASSPSWAVLQATNTDGWWGSTNLVYSKLTVKVGPQWLDVEEEAEIQAVPGWESSSRAAWQVDGTFDVPNGTTIVGCVLWNHDTLLMGKLRGLADAKSIYDSLTQPRVRSAPVRDPLLVEQVGDNTYALHLFPFTANGTRRFRLRYLVPANGSQLTASIKPLMASAINGTLPAQFRLKMRGAATGTTVQVGSAVWPADIPSSELFDLPRTGDVTLRWPGSGNPGGRAIRSKTDSGTWAGDYVLYSGKVPDSIAAKVGLKSETVVLWNWVDPKSFLSNCYYYWSYSNTGRCLTDFGSEALSQAGKIQQLAQKVGADGNRIGLVADQGLADSAKVFPLADSGTAAYSRLIRWLGGIDQNYLESLIPPGADPGYGDPSDPTDFAKHRRRFRTDIRVAGSLYSADSGILRHLVVVTVGPVPENADSLEAVDPAALPKNVSVQATKLSSTYSWNGTSYDLQAIAAKWPGIDLAGLEFDRSKVGNLADWQDGTKLPRIRTAFAGRLSIQGSNGTIQRSLVVQKAEDGNMYASLNAHGIGLGQSVKWSLYDEKGKTLSSWDDLPQWVSVANDSVVPRLWARSDAPASLVFEDKPLAPLFGFVDRSHALLATASDTVGKARQAALADSGVPFLARTDIVLSRNGGGEDPSTTSVAKRLSSKLAISFLANIRAVRISFADETPQTVEIRDLRGKLLASWSPSQLQGLKVLSWNVPASLQRGILVVSVRTNKGMQTGRVLVQ